MISSFLLRVINKLPFDDDIDVYTLENVDIGVKCSN